MKKYIDILVKNFNRMSMAARTFLVVIVLPTFIAVIYFGFITSDIYISEAKFSVKSNNELPSVNFMDSLFGGGDTSTLNDDLYIVRDYILSRDMMNLLDRKLDLKSQFQSSHIDFFSRMDKDATEEDFYKSYKKMIEISLDTNASISTLRVKAYDPVFAQRVANLIIQKSEELVNRMTNRIIDDTMKFARSEVTNAEELVRKTSDDMSNFRYKSKSFDPGEETRALLSIVTGIETDLAKAKAELIEAESYMNPDSVQVKNLRSRVNALEKQRENEKQRIAKGNGTLEDYTQLIYDYEPLQLNKTLAEKQYASALTSLEAARAEAQQKRRYLITFVTPTIPDDAAEPNRLKSIFTVFIGSLLAYAIGGLIWAAIKDHMRN